MVRSLVAESGYWKMEYLHLWWGRDHVREVERYQLDIVGLTTMHSLHSGTSLLERDGSFFMLELSQVKSREQVWAY